MSTKQAPTEGPPAWLVATLVLALFSSPSLATWLAGSIVLRTTRVKSWHLVLPACAMLGLVFWVEGTAGALLGHLSLIESALLVATRGGRLDLVGGLARMVPLGVPVGALLAAATYTPDPAELAAQRADQPPRRPPRATQRLERLHERIETHPSTALGTFYGGDLLPWRQGDLVTLPRELFELATLLIGQPGVGKSVGAQRLGYLAARLGIQLLGLDGKGDFEFGTGLVAGYLHARPGATVAAFPRQPYNLWRGEPDHLVGRLMGVWTYTPEAEFYANAAELGLRLAFGAPNMPPVSSGVELVRRLDPGWLQKAWQGFRDEQRAVQDVKPKLSDVAIRVANLVAALGPAFDGAWSVDDVDVAVLSVPTVAKPRDGDAAIRVLLGDIAQYATSRKPTGRRSLLLFDEFSALEGGRRMAINQVERNRGFHVGVILSSQSLAALGTEEERDRLLSSANAVIAFRQPLADQVAQLAGTARSYDAALTYRDGELTSTTLTQRHHAKLEPGILRALPRGFAAVISEDRSLIVRIAKTRISPALLQHARELVYPAGQTPAELPALPAPRRWWHRINPWRGRETPS